MFRRLISGAPGCALVVISIALLVQVGSPDLNELLRYQRDAIERGQLWRLATGHFVHLGVTHLAANAAALVLLAAMCPTTWTTRYVACTISQITLGVSGGLWLLSPNVEWYVGLSGVLHGLAVAIGIHAWRQRTLLGPLLLAAIVTKLAWESIADRYIDYLNLGGDVITAAHLYGGVSGFVVELRHAARRRLAFQRVRRRENGVP